VLQPRLIMLRNGVLASPTSSSGRWRISILTRHHTSAATWSLPTRGDCRMGTSTETPTWP